MVILLSAFVIWAVFHSLTAGARVKSAFRCRFGERAYRGTYRLIYNLVSGLTLLPVLYLLATRLPDIMMWSVPMPYRLVNYTLQLIGLLGLIFALVQTDVTRFLGVRQLARYLRGEGDPEPPVPFIADGVYRLVRHPLYLFSMIFLWANPEMSLSSLALTLWATIYFYVGSIYEERRLLLEFGDAYLEYQTRIPRIIPLNLSAYRQSSAGK